ncbi:MAG: hypothetical protein PSX42_06630 [bacterium]|nr:hypothetical protein [bacterium]
MREWINNRYGTNFDEEDLTNIKDFSLIWNVFEDNICGNNFSIQSLQQGLVNRNIDSNLFQEHLDYFKNRYVNAGAFTHRFQFLYFRNNDRQQLVEDVLLGVNNNSNDKILAIAIIVYRFRNNLFHGLKEIQHIDQQNKNFKVANRFLTTLIDNF